MTPSVTLPVDPRVGSTSPAVRLVGVTKQFDDFVAVQPTDLDIERNEFFSILGPSGCGKTTLMRMITGFEKPSGGTIELAGSPVDNVQTRKRDLNMLFQSYALFPHLTVFENVAFELRVRRVPKETIRPRVEAALALVRLESLAQRKPDQLSGGQRQRVALARAVVGRPSVVLLDEPLGALDKQLRKEMQFELKRLQREVGITFIYVTHDQEEALTMSDRIAVMSQGAFHQVGTPEEIYSAPATEFVASFIGECNLIRGNVNTTMDGALVNGVGLLPAHVPSGLAAGEAVTLIVRPERVRVSSTPPAEGDWGIEGTLDVAAYLGDEWRMRVRAGGGQTFAATMHAGGPVDDLIRAGHGSTVWLTWRQTDALLLPPGAQAVPSANEELTA